MTLLRLLPQTSLCSHGVILLSTVERPFVSNQRAKVQSSMGTPPILRCFFRRIADSLTPKRAEGSGVMMTFEGGPWDDHVGHLLHMPGHILIRCVWLPLCNVLYYNGVLALRCTLIGIARSLWMALHARYPICSHWRCDSGMGGGRTL